MVVTKTPCLPNSIFSPASTDIRRSAPQADSKRQTANSSRFRALKTGSCQQ